MACSFIILNKFVKYNWYSAILHSLSVLFECVELWSHIVVKSQKMPKTWCNAPWSCSSFPQKFRYKTTWWRQLHRFFWRKAGTASGPDRQLIFLFWKSWARLLVRQWIRSPCNSSLPWSVLEVGLFGAFSLALSRRSGSKLFVESVRFRHWKIH